MSAAYREGLDQAAFGAPESRGCCGGSGCAICRGQIDDRLDPRAEPAFALNADDRGGFGTNGKQSFDSAEAALQLTRQGVSWSNGPGQAATVTYGFRSTAPEPMPSDTAGFSRFTDLQINVTLQALAAWSDVANITFVRAIGPSGDSAYSNEATMLFGNYSSGEGGAAAFAYLPGSRVTTSASGDVWINNSINYNATPVALAYGPHVLAHEIGHAIGLSHPAAYNAEEGVSITYAADAVYYEDSRQYTIMSYFSEGNTGGNFTVGGQRQYAAAPQLDDIAAAQRLYGANMSTRTGDTVYGVNSNAGQMFNATGGTSVIFAIWDAGGNDTLDASGATPSQLLDLRQGSFSDFGGLTGNVAIAVGAVIENAIGGSGSDRIFGNAADNLLVGGGGQDVIDGGLGIDTVVFSGAFSSYSVQWNANVGTVTQGLVTTRLTNVEFLRFADITVAAAPTGGLIVSGDITDNVMTGTAFTDTMNGQGGNDVLDGLGGSDSLSGGAGNDVIRGGDAEDVISGDAGDDVLDGGQSTDMVIYSGAPGGVTVNLATGRASGAAGNDLISNFENIRGSSFNDVLIGDALPNLIIGFGGSDTISGAGGDDYLMAAVGGVLSGGAPDISKPQGVANGSPQAAVSLDAGFDLVPRDGVTDSTTIPHATVLAQTHGGVEYFAFTVTAGARAIFDIDGATFDSTLRIVNGQGVELAANDDNNADGFNATDSYLSYTFAQAGVYYVQVGQYIAGATPDAPFGTTVPAAGGSYTLNVSITGHAVAPTFVLGSTFNGGAGNDTIFGAEGIDTVVLDGALSSYVFERVANTADGYRIVAADGSVDTVGLIEQVQVDGRVLSLAEAATSSSFDAYRYLASYADLRPIFVNDPAGAYQHFVQFGRAEGRSDTAFDTLAYIASNPDLIRAFGANTRVASEHYVKSGIAEGRVTTGFDASLYAASHSDLARVFGTDGDAAARHYIQTGFYEGRSTSGFDGLTYAASNPDLARVFGLNAGAAETHYLSNGADEGRSVATFNADIYAASNLDLARIIGFDPARATAHYLTNGVYEGRATTGFDAEAYVRFHPDLAGLTPAQGLRHWLTNGADEGRAPGPGPGASIAADPTADAAMGYPAATESFGMDAHGADAFTDVLSSSEPAPEGPDGATLAAWRSLTMDRGTEHPQIVDDDPRALFLVLADVLTDPTSDPIWV